MNTLTMEERRAVAYALGLVELEQERLLSQGRDREADEAAVERGVLWRLLARDLAPTGPT
jgi:hypothetical protein